MYANQCALEVGTTYMLQGILLCVPYKKLAHAVVEECAACIRDHLWSRNYTKMKSVTTHFTGFEN